jgi:hypothetical protein
MVPFRLQIKFFIANPESVDLASMIGVFQRWIQKKSLDSLLIDVADYSHVFQGPGVILIGHDADYGLDMGAGRAGLLFTRKRQTDADTAQQLRNSFRLALSACNLIETDPTLEDKLKFRTDEVEIRFLDRLQLPNKPESLDLVKDELNALLAEIYGGATVTLSLISTDPRQYLTVIAKVNSTASVGELLAQLKSPEASS